MRNVAVEEQMRQKAEDRRTAQRLRQDKRDPRIPLTSDDGHPMGCRVCLQCGAAYPWISFQTRAGAVPQCLPCREAPTA